MVQVCRFGAAGIPRHGKYRIFGRKTLEIKVYMDEIGHLDDVNEAREDVGSDGCEFGILPPGALDVG